MGFVLHHFRKIQARCVRRALASGMGGDRLPGAVRRLLGYYTCQRNTYVLQTRP